MPLLPAIALTLTTALSPQQTPVTPADLSPPAPLFRDPLFDGAADPVLVFHPTRKTWWMVYTQRRARLHLKGVAWCHGSELGIAESKDNGKTWNYIGQLNLPSPAKPRTLWAPDIIRDDQGTYHLFVSQVPGDPDQKIGWDGDRYILRYTSQDLFAWKFEQGLPTTSNKCIDPTLYQMPDKTWRVWFKDEGNRSETKALESKDLTNWSPVETPGVSKLYGEAPKVFQLKGTYWMIKDPDSGLDVYRSHNLTDWTYQGKILDQPGVRNDDGSIGKHPDVIVNGDRAFIIYFTHPNGQDYPLKDGYMPMVAKRTSIQAAELEVVNNQLVCDRDKPFEIDLGIPKQ